MDSRFRTVNRGKPAFYGFRHPPSVFRGPTIAECQTSLSLWLTRLAYRMSCMSSGPLTFVLDMQSTSFSSFRRTAKMMLLPCPLVATSSPSSDVVMWILWSSTSDRLSVAVAVAVSIGLSFCVETILKSRDRWLVVLTYLSLGGALWRTPPCPAFSSTRPPCRSSNARRTADVQVRWQAPQVRRTLSPSSRCRPFHR